MLFPQTEIQDSQKQLRRVSGNENRGIWGKIFKWGNGDTKVCLNLKVKLSCGLDGKWGVTWTRLAYSDAGLMQFGPKFDVTSPEPSPRKNLLVWQPCGPKPLMSLRNIHEPM